MITCELIPLNFVLLIMKIGTNHMLSLHCPIVIYQVDKELKFWECTQQSYLQRWGIPEFAGPSYCYLKLENFNWWKTQLVHF